MTDYNDGKWHGWNGGECPVHPKSVVEAIWHDPNKNTAGFQPERTAYEDEGPRLAWSHVVKFRVVREYYEPREFWIVNGSVAMPSLSAAEALCAGNEGYTITHVREVTP